MYRDRLRDRSALVLLDNAANEEQVRDLIPASPSCLVLVTSRRSLAGLDGVTPHLIDTFADAEALDLLIRIVGRDRVTAESEAASRIIQSCDRLPSPSPRHAYAPDPPGPSRNWPRGSRPTGWRPSAPHGRAVRPVFDLSYRELTKPLQRAFRLLGHHHGPDFTPAVVAALADIPTPEAQDALEQLQDENLVRQNTPGRYELHDLVRAYVSEVAETAPEPDPTAPLARLATWAVATGYAAALAIGSPPSPVSPPRGLEDPRVSLATTRA
ncbi:hypothetical protein ACQ4WX_50050 [Streptomyces lasalocidi]